jgi:hypothetical protein
MTAAKDKAVVPVQENPVAMAADAFSDFAGEGFAGVGKDDMAIPFITILQGLSPEVKRNDPAYIEGAQEGMFLNTVTRELHDPVKNGPLVLISCHYARTFLEWRLREKGGGFVAEHTLPSATIRDERGRDILENGNQLNDTRTFYVLAMDANGMPQPAVVSMTSTQIKKAKQWLMQQNLLRLSGPNGSYQPPMFASKWNVTTVTESNEKGSWSGWKFTHAGYLAGPSDPLFVAAREFHDSVVSGAAKITPEQRNAAQAPVGEGVDRTPTRAPGDGLPPEDDIPF